MLFCCFFSRQKWCAGSFYKSLNQFFVFFFSIHSYPYLSLCQSVSEKLFPLSAFSGSCEIYTRFRLHSLLYQRGHDAACSPGMRPSSGANLPYYALQGISCPSGYIWQKAFSMYAPGIWYRKNDTDGTGYFINFLLGIFSERFLSELIFRTIFSETRFSITIFWGSMYLKSAFLRNSCVLLKWGQRFIHMFRIWQKERI